MTKEATMQTSHAHAQALRALARVSLTFAVMGCIEDPAAFDSPTADAALDAAIDAEVDTEFDAELDATLPPITPDAEIFVDALVDPEVPDGEPVELDAGPDALVADGSVDAMVDCGPWRDDPEFWECCDEHPMTQSCNPWGPPMPPAFVLA